MKKFTLCALFSFSSILCCSITALAQIEKPYKEGPVWNVSFIQTKPGMQDTYLKDLSEHWIKVMEEAKREGIIIDYKIIASAPAAKTDWDLMLMTQFKNFAALDDTQDKFDAIAKKLFETEDAQHKAAISRNDMRDQLGGKLGRELIFKQ